jgi:hypothetical protein
VRVAIDAGQVVRHELADHVEVGLAERLVGGGVT